jgi:hypothetical protein
VWTRTSNTAGNATGIVRAGIKIGGTAYNSTDLNNTYGYTNQSYTWDLNPSTSANWTWDDINNLQAGASLKDWSGFQNKLTQVWVVINYTVPVAQTSIENNYTFFM